MKKFLSSIAIASSMTLGVIGLLQADVLTGRSITDDFLSGKLDARLTELGTNLQTQEFMPQWYKTQLEGVKRHCTFTLVARGVKDTKACNR